MRVFLIFHPAGDVIGSAVGERRWGFSRRTRWMDVSVIRRITVCFPSRPGSFCTQCETGSNLAKSVFHLSLEQTRAGEPGPICYRCEIPTPLNLILKQQMDACQVCFCVKLRKQAAVLLYNQERTRFTFFLDLSRHTIPKSYSHYNAYYNFTCRKSIDRGRGRHIP